MSATAPPPAAISVSADAAAVHDAAPCAPARPAERRFELAPCDPATVEALRGALGISRTLAQVLVRRGLDEPAAARAFLAADERHDPSALRGIEVAVETVLRHVRAGSRITVHGDYDVDGVCSTAILLRALRRLGADADSFLPSRIDDGYGLALGTVERLAARGTRLLITVDCAITAVEEVDAARAAGLDVVVTDHHQPRSDGRLPDAPIVHPALCGYPFPDLCAGGVAYKLAQALYAAAGTDPATADEDLDLVALATVADLVPLRGENRRLVRAGLRALANTGKPGLRALMRVSKVDPSGLDARAVGYRLAPRINAAGRLYRADAGVELLLTGDEARAAAIADELDHANAERRQTEQRILFEAQAQVRELGERPAYVLAGEGWHPGVIGIVASRVVELTNRPALMVALDPETGQGTGSGRSIRAFDLLGALHAIAPAVGLERYGGHRAAAGLTIGAGTADEVRGQVQTLRAAFEAHAAAVLAPEDLVPVERVDAVVGGRALGLALAEELARLEPTGMGNPAVKLLVPGATLADVRPMGEEGRHARFTVQAGGVRCRAVAFGCDGRLPVPADVPADVTVRLERNEWNGAVEPRLLLRHAVAAAPAPIEVLGEPAPDAWWSAVLAELDAQRASAGLAAAPLAGGAVATVARTVLDRRGEGGSAVLADLVAGGASVLAVCADVGRRHDGLASRVGGFALCSHAALARAPRLADAFDHLVVLDPPACREDDARLRARAAAAGGGWVHLTWGDAELRFAQQIHESEYDVRTALVPFYRALRRLGRADGEELGRLLRGDGPHGRTASLAARLIGVLEELGLVSLDRDLPALAVASTERTELERSAIFRAATARYEDGQRFLLETATTPEQPSA
jgi:single-stranded-DNA-specific exonuclease